MTLAEELLLFAMTVPLTDAQLFRLRGIAARVRRLELALDEIAADAQESAVLAERAANVVHVNFAGR